MTIRTVIIATILGLAALSATTHANQTPAAASSTMTMLTDGEVRKIDPAAGKITIKHGPIQHMDMPGMTMVFTARDKALPRTLVRPSALACSQFHLSLVIELCLIAQDCRIVALRCDS